jgi:methylglyoxal reductase
VASVSMLRSRVGLGTAPLGSHPAGPLWWGRQDPDDAVDAVRAAIDAGVDWIDTAPFYGWGRAEELVGRALTGCRDKVRILTKCGTVRGPPLRISSLKGWSGPVDCPIIRST